MSDFVAAEDATILQMNAKPGEMTRINRRTQHRFCSANVSACALRLEVAER